MKLNKKVAISESGFVFDSSSGDSFSINNIGIEIINLIREEKTEDEIIDTLLQKYEVSTPVLEKSLNDFYNQMKDLKILID